MACGPNDTADIVREAINGMVRRAIHMIVHETEDHRYEDSFYRHRPRQAGASDITEFATFMRFLDQPTP